MHALLGKHRRGIRSFIKMEGVTESATTDLWRFGEAALLRELHETGVWELEVLRQRDRDGVVAVRPHQLQDEALVLLPAPTQSGSIMYAGLGSEQERNQSATPCETRTTMFEIPCMPTTQITRLNDTMVSSAAGTSRAADRQLRGVR